VTLYVLDTDRLSLHLHGHPQVRERLAQIAPDALAVTIITDLKSNCAGAWRKSARRRLVIRAPQPTDTCTKPSLIWHSSPFKVTR